MKRFLHNHADAMSLLAAFAGVLAILAAAQFSPRPIISAADSPPPPVSTSAAAALMPVQSPGTHAAATSTPAPADLQSALAAALAAKAALDKATSDLASAKTAVDSSTTAYAAAVQAYYDLANVVIPPPKPQPINPDNVPGDILIVVHNGTHGPWEAADAQAAIKASGLAGYVYDATSLTLNAVQKAWVDHARADGPLPWIGVATAGSAGTKIVYHGRADDGRLLDVVNAFAKPPKAEPVVEAAKPILAPAMAKKGYWENSCGPCGYTTVWKEDE